MRISILFTLVTGVIFFLILSSLSYAGVVAALEPLTPDDRILILAPHPDDEAIATGGLIQSALEAGARVKVVLLTNGENNQFSFMALKKRPVLLPREVVRMGLMRHQESVAAMVSLGLNQKDIEVLGYPDYGTMEIFQKYWGPVKKPFRAMFSRQRFVPYKNARSFRAPYVGESILQDIKEILLNLRPTRIFVSHPVDVNRDHRAAYLFLKVALWDLEDRIGEPQVLPYLVHAVGWPVPRGYFPEKELYVPKDLVRSDIIWRTFLLEKEKVGRKRKAISLYPSQNRGVPRYLVTFARANELFGDYPPVPIFRQMNSVPVWQQVMPVRDPAVSKKAREAEQIAGLSYARVGNDLLIRLRLRRIADMKSGASLFLFGYKTGRSFSQMPKIHISVGMDGIRVRDKRKVLGLPNIRHGLEGKDMIFTIPLSFLGYPEKILSSAQTALYDLTFDETAWRVLVIK